MSKTTDYLSKLIEDSKVVMDEVAYGKSPFKTQELIKAASAWLDDYSKITETESGEVAVKAVDKRKVNTGEMIENIRQSLRFIKPDGDGGAPPFDQLCLRLATIHYENAHGASMEEPFAISVVKQAQPSTHQARIVPMVLKSAALYYPFTLTLG